MIKVFTNGCFDLFHCGHLYILEEAKKFGDELHVGINSDSSIKKLKGPNRPIIPQKERVSIIKALRCVDYVHIFDEETPIELIKEIKPDIIVKGGDWSSDEVVGHELAKVETIKRLPSISTTNIIWRIEDRCDKKRPTPDTLDFLV